jgi:hypothetical protein
MDLGAANRKPLSGEIGFDAKGSVIIPGYRRKSILVNEGWSSHGLRLTEKGWYRESSSPLKKARGFFYFPVGTLKNKGRFGKWLKRLDTGKYRALVKDTKF